MPHFMIVLILYINILNLSWKKKMSSMEEYGAFNICFCGEIKCLDIRFIWRYVGNRDNLMMCLILKC